jgi:cytidine deaminase
MKKIRRHVSPEQLMEAAQKARSASYSPYSKFKVGAALLIADGRIITGANIENGSYGLTVCAERVAVFNAVSTGVNKGFSALAVAAGRRTAVPCGACLQVLSEFARDMKVYYAGKNGRIISTSLSRLLPEKFSFREKT